MNLSIFTEYSQVWQATTLPVLSMAAVAATDLNWTFWAGIVGGYIPEFAHTF